MGFKDHFSKASDKYALYRPEYPEELFRYLASLVPSKKRAWDCATGSGQAARQLIPFFDEVIASDASESQIDNAPKCGRIDYRVMAAERTDIEDASVDLITVGQALHWLDIEAFYKEARRVLKADGILAAWAYALMETDRELHQTISEYYHDVLGEYWPPERTIIEAAYRTVEFPFEELPAPVFVMSMNWTIDQLKGYLGTWSASLRYRDRHQQNPVELIADRLASGWGRSRRRKMTWPIHLRVGRKRKP